MHRLVALLTLLFVPLAQAAGPCGTFPRMLIAPPAAGLNAILVFRNPSSGAQMSGLIRGFSFAAEISITNVGTLPQNLEIAIADMKVGASIKGDTTPYTPAHWQPSSYNIYYGSLSSSAIPDAHADDLKVVMTVAPGATVRKGIGLICIFDSPAMTNCAPSGSAGVALLSGFTPLYTGFNPPRWGQVGITAGLRICVKGPVNKESMGAVIGSVSYKVGISGSPIGGAEADDSNATSEFATPLLSGFAF